MSSVTLYLVFLTVEYRLDTPEKIAQYCPPRFFKQCLDGGRKSLSSSPTFKETREN